LAINTLWGGFDVALGGFAWICAVSGLYFFFLLSAFCFDFGCGFDVALAGLPPFLLSAFYFLLFPECGFPACQTVFHNSTLPPVTPLAEWHATSRP